MKTHELAQELDRLARALRSLTSAASEAVAEQLELGRRRGYVPATKFEPRALTVAEISNALAAATRRPTNTVELRKDVFERRCERLAPVFASKLEADVKADRTEPGGVRMAACYTSLPAGARSIFGAIPSFAKTPINADVNACLRAASYGLYRLIPAYGRNEIYRHAMQVCAPDHRRGYDLENKLNEAVDRWVGDNTTILCDLDQAGQVVRVTGLDPVPFIELHKAVLAGNPDPLGIFKTS